MEKIEYKVVYSKRKTIKLSIDNSGMLIINAPIGTSEVYINEVINRKRNWIVKNIESVNSRIMLKDTEVMYLGKVYKKIL